ncbi:hypothetical protein KFE25_001599 [Diacronema lutheri]|uniref:Uncharacterized protein n=1 Tax=Diacronema lutheri TaxID=2081491 RepID=A0A8J5XC91_DIALT|nr:hypothetical protein KFE25_001599 [Diacronema lutheri]
MGSAGRTTAVVVLALTLHAAAGLLAPPSASWVVRSARARVRAVAADDAYNSVFAFNTFGAADARRKWADPKVKASVVRTLIDALDNLRPAEVAMVVDRLWAAGPSVGAEGVSVQRLIELAERIEQLERMASRGEADPYELGDEARTVRSRMRMYARDARLYPGVDLPFFDLL